MRILVLATGLLASHFFGAPALANPCLPYGPTEVSLSGVLRTKAFPVPPNYESIKKGDRKETAWLLTLSNAVCTSGNEYPDVSETNLRQLQLVIMKTDHWKTVRSLKGKRIKVTGTLFHSHTGHHRTRVLIEVRNIRAAE